MAVKESTGKVEIGGREPKTKDGRGRVRLYLSLNDDKNKPVKDNITAALYIKGSTVTEVQKRIVEVFSK
jgi:hypothetical protein